MRYSLTIRYNKILHEILTKNVKKLEDLLTTFDFLIFPPEKKLLNVFFMRNKAWGILECIS